jgi:hypothetical protein
MKAPRWSPDNPQALQRDVDLDRQAEDYRPSGYSQVLRHEMSWRPSYDRRAMERPGFLIDAPILGRLTEIRCIDTPWIMPAD